MARRTLGIRKLRLGLGAQSGEAGTIGPAPITLGDFNSDFNSDFFVLGDRTDPTRPDTIVLSADRIDDDAATGTLIGYLLAQGDGDGRSYTWSIEHDPLAKFQITNGNELRSAASLVDMPPNYEIVTKAVNDLSFSMQDYKMVYIDAVAEENESGIEEGDGNVEVPDPDDPETDQGGFDIPPTQQNTKDGLKITGKNGGSAVFLYDLGVPKNGAQYIMQYTCDWSQMNQQGRRAAVGFGFKSGNEFHMVSARGNGQNPVTMKNSQIYGDFRKGNQFTVTDDGDALYITKDGPNWVMVDTAADGSTYNFSTSNGQPVDLHLKATCVGWYKADQLSGSDGSDLTAWADASGHGNHMTVTAAPILELAELNGLNVVRFVSGADVLTLPNVFSGATEGAAFIVVKGDSDPSDNRLWDFGTDNQANHYPYIDGNIYEGWGSTSRKSTGNPTPSLASWRIYYVHSAPSDWANYIDGTLHFSTSSNTVDFDTAPKLGNGGSGGFSGYVAEMILLSAKPDADLRQIIEGYLAHKWGLASNLASDHPYKSTTVGSWAVAYTDETPAPMGDVSDALAFGPSAYFANQDKGIFSITYNFFDVIWNRVKLFQQYAEVIHSGNPANNKVRLSQQYAEVIHSGDPSANKVRLAQQYAEVIHSGDPGANKVRVAQQYVEVVHSYDE